MSASHSIWRGTRDGCIDTVEDLTVKTGNFYLLLVQEKKRTTNFIFLISSISHSRSLPFSLHFFPCVIMKSRNLVLELFLLSHVLDIKSVVISADQSWLLPGYGTGTGTQRKTYAKITDAS